MFICNNSIAHSERVSYEDVDNEDVRIVSGYDSPQRPWIALFVFHEEIKDGECGGSLLNKRYCNFKFFISETFYVIINIYSSNTFLSLCLIIGD